MAASPGTHGDDLGNEDGIMAFCFPPLPPLPWVEFHDIYIG